MFFIIYCNSSIIIPIFELTYNFFFHYMDMVEIEKLASIQIEDFFLFIFANLFSFLPFSCRIYLSLLLLSFVCSNHFPFINLWNFFAVTHFSSLVTTLLSLVIPLTFKQMWVNFPMEVFVIVAVFSLLIVPIDHIVMKCPTLFLSVHSRLNQWPKIVPYEGHICVGFRQRLFPLYTQFNNHRQHHLYHL